jgi:hypothetical protein
MNQAQNNADNEVKLDFFTKNAEKINKISYRKLIVTVLMFGAFTGLVIGGTSIAYRVWQDAKLQNQQQTLDALNNEVAQIRQIDDAHFTRFLNYLNLNQAFYDTRVTILNKAVMESVRETHFNKDYDNPSEVTDDLNNGLSEYKKAMEWRLNKFSNIYQKVHLNGKVTANDSEGDYKQLLQYYHNYQAGVWTTDPDVEKLLNKTLYSSKNGTLEYYNDNHVMDAYNQALQAENELLKKLAF